MKLESQRAIKMGSNSVRYLECLDGQGKLSRVSIDVFVTQHQVLPDTSRAKGDLICPKRKLVQLEFYSHWNGRAQKRLMPWRLEVLDID